MRQLIIIITFFLPSIFAQSCFVPGECTESNLISAQPTDDANGCLKLCQNTTECTWFTYITYAGLCETLKNCGLLSVSNCADCVSGEVTCTVPECNVNGLCQVSKTDSQ